MNFEKIKFSNTYQEKIKKEFSLDSSQYISYNIIFLDNEGKASMLEVLITISKTSKDFKINKINIKENNLNKKNFENYIKLIDGIIFLFITPQNEIINNSIEYIYNLYKKIHKEKEKLIPIIIFGKKSDIIKDLASKNEKKLNKINNILFISKSDKLLGFDSPIKEFLKIKLIYENYENFIINNKINEMNIINNLNKIKLNLKKCSTCNQIFKIKFDQFSNFIFFYCKNCNKEEKIDILQFINTKNLKKCNECNKNINSDINYCFMCKKNICNECEKIHLQKEEKNNNKKLGDILYHNNLIDIICNIHNRICYNYCLKCNKNICLFCEIDSHMEHETKIYDEKNINKLISEEKRNIEIERAKYKSIKMLIDESINDLKNYLDNLMIYKEKEIEIKEEMIKECEIIKYDKILIENIKNFNLNNDKKWINRELETWDKKLNSIFDFFNEPIKISKTKLCVEENLKGPFNILNQVKFNRNSNINDNKDSITDIISLFNHNGKNHFAVSFDNGLLKIYNDEFENRIPIQIIREFEDKEGINSIYKCSRKSLMLVGNTKIKKILLSENLSEYKVINKIELKDQFFKKAIDFNCLDILITSNYFNQIFCINYKDGNLLSDLTTKVNTPNEKDYEILFMDKISDNKILFLFLETKLMRVSINRETLVDPIFEKEINNEINHLNNKIYSGKDLKNTFWKIIELDLNKNNNIEIIKNHLFEREINYLGQINGQLIMLFNNFNSKIIIFDIISFSKNIELDFNYIEKPIMNFPLKSRKDIFDIIILCEEENLFQYVLNLKLGLIYPIAKIKINQKINKNVQLIDSYTDTQESKEKEIKNNITKIINLEKNNFLFMANDFNIYNLKHTKL